MPMATRIGDSSTTKTRVEIGSVQRSGNGEEITIEILIARRHEAMVPIVMIGGVTLGPIMSLGTVTLVRQNGDLLSPPSDENAVCLRLETAVVLRRRGQGLESLPLTGPRQLGQARGVHLGDVPHHLTFHETRLH
eukprot:gene62760-85830_t